MDTDSDGVANQYFSVGQMSPFDERWLQVTSVKLELLVRSLVEVSEVPQAYFFAGQRWVPEDLFIRRHYVATIDLRNRIQ